MLPKAEIWLYPCLTLQISTGNGKHFHRNLAQLAEGTQLPPLWGEQPSPQLSHWWLTSDQRLPNGKIASPEFISPPGRRMQIPLPGSQLSRVISKSPYSPKWACPLPPSHSPCAVTRVLDHRCCQDTSHQCWELSSWMLGVLGIDSWCGAQESPAICVCLSLNLVSTIFSCIALHFCIVDVLKKKLAEKSHRCKKN